jgi:hypothetical protein
MYRNNNLIGEIFGDWTVIGKEYKILKEKK